MGLVLAIGAAAAAVLPLVRVLVRLRGPLRSEPAVATALALLVVGWLVVVGLVATFAAAALPVLAGAVLIALAAGTWRARASCGRSRGLPPGSLALTGSIPSLLDDRFYLAQAERHGPVFKTMQLHRPTACVVGIERGAELLRANADRLRAAPLPFSDAIPRGFLRYMSPTDHAHYGAVFQTAFARDVVRACEPDVARRLGAAVEGMAATDGVIDPRGVIREAVLGVLLRVVLGVPPESPGFEPLATVYRRVDFSAPGANGAWTSAIAQVTRVLAAHPGATDRASFLSEIIRRDRRALDDPTVTGNLTFILNLAHQNVSGLCLWILHTLGRETAWCARVRDLLPAGAASDLAHRIVLETLRLEQSEYVYRIADRDVPVDGYTIPAGWLVRVCVRESHRSPAAFANPERFDPDRFASDGDRVAFSPFGFGAHACIGGALTTTVGRLWVEALASAPRWHIAADGPRRRQRLRHWSHWTPSPGLRVVFEPDETP